MKRTITILGMLFIGFIASAQTVVIASVEKKLGDNVTIENESKTEMNENLIMYKNNTENPCKPNGGYLCVQDEYFCMFYQNEWKQNEYGKVFYKWKCRDGHVEWNTFQYIK
jgi:hypothetical protein